MVEPEKAAMPADEREHIERWAGEMLEAEFAGAADDFLPKIATARWTLSVGPFRVYGTGVLVTAHPKSPPSPVFRPMRRTLSREKR